MSSVLLFLSADALVVCSDSICGICDCVSCVLHLDICLTKFYKMEENKERWYELSEELLKEFEADKLISMHKYGIELHREDGVI